MDNSCRLKLEWVPLAYAVTMESVKDRPLVQHKQGHPENGIYQSRNGFTKHKPHRRKL